MQMIECMVAVGNDPQNIVHRDPSRPVSYPEMLILQYIHGEEAITDAYHVGEEERDNGSELERLRIAYGARAVQDVFPGSRPRLPLRNTQIKPRLAPARPRRKPVPDRLGEVAGTHDGAEDGDNGPATDMPEDDAPGAPNPDESLEDMGLPPVVEPAAPRRIMRGRPPAPAAPGDDVDMLRDGE